jgi:hypothetical protein
MTRCRGRSGLPRAGRWATPTRSDPRDSATESRPPRSSDRGKGETVVQETTSGPGDRVGSANPARSKVEQRTLEGCPPECAGGPQEAAGNGGRRWMVAERDAARRPGTEPGLQTSPSASGPSDLQQRFRASQLVWGGTWGAAGSAAGCGVSSCGQAGVRPFRSRVRIARPRARTWRSSSFIVGPRGSEYGARRARSRNISLSA